VTRFAYSLLLSHHKTYNIFGEESSKILQEERAILNFTETTKENHYLLLLHLLVEEIPERALRNCLETIDNKKEIWEHINTVHSRIHQKESKRTGKKEAVRISLIKNLLLSNDQNKNKKKKKSIITGA